MSSDKIERRNIYYSGRVQGVGFRFTTNEIARGMDVAGFVRNLSDGRVELVVEGNPDAIDGFLKAIRDQLGSNIRDVESASERATGQFDGFEIRT